MPKSLAIVALVVLAFSPLIGALAAWQFIPRPHVLLESRTPLEVTDDDAIDRQWRDRGYDVLRAAKNAPRDGVYSLVVRVEAER